MKYSEKYVETKQLLAETGLAVPLATELLVVSEATLQVAQGTKIGLLSENEDHLLRSVLVLRAADVCITRNLVSSFNAKQGKFEPQVNIEPLDMHIASFTRLCICPLNPDCCIPRNHVTSIAVFSGESQRLIGLLGKKEKATDFYSYVRGFQYDYGKIASQIEKAFGQFPEDSFRQFATVKLKLWCKGAEMISLSSKLSERTLE
jgi:hypothetical protein